MTSLLWRILGASAVCVGYYFLTRNLLGPVVWVFLAVVIGMAFSRILIDLMAELSWSLRAAVLEGLGGEYYQYQDWRLQVLEDESHCRWVPVDEVRKIVGNLASDRTLAHVYLSGCLPMGKPPKPHLRDDALLAHLAHAPSIRSIKFKNWAERNIAFPARTTRKRLGIQLADPTRELDH